MGPVCFKYPADDAVWLWGEFRWALPQEGLPFAVGFGIELSQLFINWILGYSYRVVDVTDALLNAVGVLIGYGFFRLFSRVYIAGSSSIHKEPRGLFAYVHKVASRG